MRLGIISDCIHYRTNDGSVGTEVHILLRQLEALSIYFTETIICCPFGTPKQGQVLSFYQNKNIQFVPVPVVGGNTLKDKLNIVAVLPKWISAFKKVNKRADIVYQRFPNNLNIPGFFFFHFTNKKVFATYTGTWSNYTNEPSTYRFQKWLLKKYFKGPVWIYSADTKGNEKFHSGFSPSYTLAEWNEETVQVQQRSEQIKKEGINTFRLITVGSLVDYKNQLTILRACVILKSRNFPFYLTVVGGGPMFAELDQFIRDNNLSNEVTLAGMKNYQQLRALYRENDFVVQAPLSEGFGKVPIEGFFHGVVPVINDLSMAKHITGNEDRGFLFDTSSPENLANKLEQIAKQTDRIPTLIANGRAYAKTQTLDAWAENYYKTVKSYFEEA